MAEYLTVVAAGYGGGTAGTYRSYWRLLESLHGDRSVGSMVRSGLIEIA